MASVRPEARRLVIRARGQTAVLGIEDDYGWEPPLRLGHPSAACNVMSLDVRSKGRWQPSFYRGTPQQLAEPLTGDIHFTWSSWVRDLDPDPSGTSDHGH